MRAIVTGGAGFIGAHLVRRLLQEGVAVTVVERPGASLENLSGLDVRTMTADVSTPGSIRPALDGCDVLFHLAANPRLWAGDGGAPIPQIGFLGFDAGRPAGAVPPSPEPRAPSRRAGRG